MPIQLGRVDFRYHNFTDLFKLAPWIMVAIASERPNMSAEEYLDWEPRQDFRYEYVYGEVIAMTGGTIPHNDIALNLYTALRPHLRERGCRANVADVKVQVNGNGLYYYPDLVVSCDPQDLTARRFIQNPTMIAEVLSPGTSARDRGEKLTNYLTIPSLQAYLLIDTEKVSVECYCRGEGRMWLYYAYTEGETINFSNLGLALAIATIYEGINL